MVLPPTPSNPYTDRRQDRRGRGPRVKPALVRIKVVATQYYQGREVKFEASGSGVIISKEGYVITNHHVAGHATRIVVILPEQRGNPRRPRRRPTRSPTSRS